MPGNDGEDLDDYDNADEYVKIRADGSIGWNTKTAPKFYVNCKVHHALAVATFHGASFRKHNDSENTEPKSNKHDNPRNCPD